MLRKLVLIIVLALPLISTAQYWEVGLLGGVSFYSGDLTESVIDVKEIHPGYGGIIRYNINPWVTIKGNAYYGKLSGNDAHAKTFEKKTRNLSFQSTILDVGMQAEVNLRGYRAGHPRFKNSPYLFMGLSVFRFNPRAFYDGTWYELQPLGTEGQGTTKYNDREKYALTQICLPLGFGWKYAINRYWNVGFEFGSRITFTDYIDDVSTTYVEPDIVRGSSGFIGEILANRSGNDYPTGTDRGDPTKMDRYFFTGLTISYNILPNACYRF